MYTYIYIPLYLLGELSDGHRALHQDAGGWLRLAKRPGDRPGDVLAGRRLHHDLGQRGGP